MFAKCRRVNGIFNHGLSHAAISQKAAHSLGFENSMGEGFGDLAIASHKMVDVAGHKSPGSVLSSALLGWCEPCSFLFRILHTAFRMSQGMYFIRLALVVQQARSQTNLMPRMSKGLAL